MMLFDKYHLIFYKCTSEAGVIDSNSTIQAALTQQLSSKTEQFFQNISLITEKLPQDAYSIIRFCVPSSNQTDLPIMFTFHLTAATYFPVIYQFLKSNDYVYAELCLLTFLKISLIKIIDLAYSY